MDRIRPFVPEIFRREIFHNLHALSHLGVRASLKMVSERYVWPSMRQDVALWAHTCLQCQRAKVSRHTRSETGKFEIPSSRFEHVHIDLVRHTTPYHPAANGQVERFHRQLRAAIMAHGSSQWTTVLSTILMGFRATWKEDVQATAAEMIYEDPIRLPGEFLCLSDKAQNLLLLWGDSGSQCSVSHLRQPNITVNIQSSHGKEVSGSINRLKPAYIPKESKDIPVEVKLKGKVSHLPEDVTEFEQDCSRQETTTRSGRRVRFNPKYC
ncbi:transposon Ty3-I Gag-Pol polyprotein [Trichonephila clavipes]|nr:transposon Ty3-I Gag-Pol polyprotein [Trichonephila clavipes]